MQQPPLLPEEVLVRVLRVSRVNGLAVCWCAGFFALVSAAAGDFVGATGGLIVAGAGAMEVHGGTLLNHYDTRGANWLVSSQLVCLLGTLAYCAVRLVHVQIPPFPDDVRAMFALDAKQLGLTTDELMLKSYRFGLMMIAVVASVYQGGLAWYYAKRRRLVMRALDLFQDV